MARRLTLFLAFLFLALPLTGCADQAGCPIEENTGRNRDGYPWLVRTPSAVWYLSVDDIGRFGKEAYLEGLYAILDSAEADFADARAVLEGFIPGEVPPIAIYTDFCNRAEQSKTSDAYFNERDCFIKVFRGWDTARASLLHEYVHYLTIRCARSAPQDAFWAEGMADYISLFACKNRLARSVNLGFDLSELHPAMLEQAWDPDDNCLDPRLVCLGFGEMAVRGYGVGMRYFAVKNEWIDRTEQIQADPAPGELFFHEAAGMVAYLVETYGKDTVFANLDLDPDHMEAVYGKSFPELYRDWAAWNEEQCRLAGIVIP